MIPIGADTKSYPFRAALAVPLKPFNSAKTRLADTFDQKTRSKLSQALAIAVLDSSPKLVPYVICESLSIRKWATDLGYRTLFNPGLSLNESLEVSLLRLQLENFTHVVVAHSDLPFTKDLSFLALNNQIVIAPDRHLLGTNAIALPVSPLETGRFRFHFGENSYSAHLREAFSRSLAPMVVKDPLLALDLDDREDLDLAQSRGFDYLKLMDQLVRTAANKRRTRT